MDKEGAGPKVLPRNVILVDSSAVSRKLFAQNIELYTGARIHLMANADEVIDQLTRKDHPIEYDLIISDNMVGDENTILKIFYTVNSQKLGIPIILLGENPKVKGEVTQIEKEKWRQVIKTAAKLMEVHAETMMEVDVPDFYPFPIYSLLFDFTAPLPLYQKIGENRYEVWKRTGEKTSKAEMRKLLLNGEDNLFVNKMLRLEFTEFLSDKLMTSLKDADLTVKERVHATGKAFDMTMAKLKNDGFSEESLKATKDLLESVVTVAANVPGLDDLMALIQESPESFLYKHSLLICALSRSCLNNLEWGNKNQIKSLTYAAFFHDMALPEDKLCIIHDHNDLKSMNLPLEDLDLIEKHALKASELVKNYPQIPMGVDQIILQHHGSLNGLGLKSDKALDNRLSPLAIVFIVLEDMVSLLLSESSPKAREALEVIEGRYTKGKEKKVVEALAKSFSR